MEDSKQILKELYEFKTKTFVELTKLQEQGSVIIEHAKETNGRVNKHDKKLESLEKDLEATIRDNNDEKTNKRWKQIARWVIVSHLVAAWFYIKESRDFIISIFFKIF